MLKPQSMEIDHAVTLTWPYGHVEHETLLQQVLPHCIALRVDDDVELVKAAFFRATAQKDVTRLHSFTIPLESSCRRLRFCSIGTLQASALGRYLLVATARDDCRLDEDDRRR